MSIAQPFRSDGNLHIPGTRTSMRVSACACICVCARMHVHVGTHACMHAFMRIARCLCAHTHLKIEWYMHARTYVHTSTHTILCWHAHACTTRRTRKHVHHCGLSCIAPHTAMHRSTAPLPRHRTLLHRGVSEVQAQCWICLFFMKQLWLQRNIEQYLIKPFSFQKISIPIADCSHFFKKGVRTQYLIFRTTVHSTLYSVLCTVWAIFRCWFRCQMGYVDTYSVQVVQ